jgi:hypothetical protein
LLPAVTLAVSVVALPKAVGPSLVPVKPAMDSSVVMVVVAVTTLTELVAVTTAA